MNILFLQFLVGLLFLTVIFLHLTKKNFAAVMAYGIQSLIIGILFLNSFFETGNVYICIMVLLTLIVKVVLAPLFLTRLIKKHNLSFSVSTYLNTPLMLIFIAVLTVVAHSHIFTALTTIIPANQALLSLTLSSLFLSLFLVINRRGVLSQILGMLSLENSIVAFIIFAGLEQSPSLQIGVIFNIFVWTMIATVFASMIYEHFGSQDVTSMKHLKD
jgi:hydrogenase-4 membrane subunit HyfE